MVEAPLDDASLCVADGVEGWRAPAARALGQAVGDLVGHGRDLVGDSAPAQSASGARVRVGLVRGQVVGAFSRAPWAEARHADCVEQGQQLGVVAGLAGGDDDRQRQPTTVDGHVDLGSQPAAGAPEGFTVDGQGFDRG